MSRRTTITLTVATLLVVLAFGFCACAGTDALTNAKKVAIIDYAFLVRVQKIVANAHANYLENPTAPAAPFLDEPQYKAVAKILDAIALAHNGYIETVKIAEKLPEGSGREEILAALEESQADINSLFSQVTKILEALGIDVNVPL